MITEQLLTRKKYMEQTDPPRLAKDTLPTMYDLPSENPEEPGVPDQFHIWQPELLEKTFYPPNHSLDQTLMANDLNLYYDVRHPSRYKRPDWYLVLGVPRLYDEHDMRLSYVMWQEKVVPFLVIEFLSPSTEKGDLGKTRRKRNEPPTKWEVYEQILGVPYYLTFSRYTDELRAFELIGQKYQELILPRQCLWFPKLQLGLGIWRDRYRNVDRRWLRWYDVENNWIPTPVEQERQQKEQAQYQTEIAYQRVEQERQQKEQAQYQTEVAYQQAEQERQQKEQAQHQTEVAYQEAEQERQRAGRLLAQLRALGIEPDLGETP